MSDRQPHRGAPDAWPERDPSPGCPCSFLMMANRRRQTDHASRLSHSDETGGHA
jgi:hypothetical protein